MVFRSLNVRLDFLNITTSVYNFATGYGCINVVFCGLPMNMTMGNILVTNNEVYGEQAQACAAWRDYHSC